MLKQLGDRFVSTKPNTALVGSGGVGYVNRTWRLRPMLIGHEANHILLLNSRIKPTSSHLIHGFFGFMQAMRLVLSKATRILPILSSSPIGKIPRKAS